MKTKRFFLGAMFALMVAGGSLLLNGCTEDLFGGGDDNNDNQGSVRNEMTMGGQTLAIDGMDVDEDDDILTLRLYNVSQQVSVYFEFPGTFNGSNGTHSYTITNPAGKSSPVYCTIETPAGITMVVSGEVTMNILGDHKGTLEASGRTDDGTEVRLSYSTENNNGGNNGGNNNGGNGGDGGDLPDLNGSLVNTAWAWDTVGSDAGYRFTATLLLAFTSTTNGYLEESASYVFNMPEWDTSWTESDRTGFTYTFDGRGGVLTPTGENADAEPVPFTLTDERHITAVSEGWEYREDNYGNIIDSFYTRHTIVFTRRR